MARRMAKQPLVWARVLADTALMNDKELRKALKDKAPERRFSAALLVGEKGLPGSQDDLVPLVGDADPIVRQVARRSLMILSFFALNDKESIENLPLSKLKEPVDF